jgi:hypothetical protein
VQRERELAGGDELRVGASDAFLQRGVPASLELPLRQRNALLLLAGYAPAYEQTGFSDAKLAPVRTAVQRILAGHDPYPAVVVDRFSELVAANAAFWTLVDGAAPELLRAPVNVARLLLDPRGLGDRIVNYGTWAWHVADAVQHEAAQNPDPRFAPLLAELEALATSARPSTSPSPSCGWRRSCRPTRRRRPP